VDLSVIIVISTSGVLENALNRAALLGACREITVDNALTTGASRWSARSFRSHRLLTHQPGSLPLTILRCERPCRYVLLLNPDTILQEDTLATMTAFMDGHPDAGVAGCKVLNPDGTLQLACAEKLPISAIHEIVGLSALFRIPARHYNLTIFDLGQTAEVEADNRS
jgi:hypothetical protein